MYFRPVSAAGTGAFFPAAPVELAPMLLVSSFFKYQSINMLFNLRTVLLAL